MAWDRSGNMNIGVELVRAAYESGDESLSSLPGSHLDTLSPSQQLVYHENVLRGVQTALKLDIAGPITAEQVYSPEGRVLILAGAIVADGISSSGIENMLREDVDSFRKKIIEQANRYKAKLDQDFESEVDRQTTIRTQNLVDEEDRKMSDSLVKWYGEAIGSLVSRLKGHTSRNYRLTKELELVNDERERYKEESEKFQEEAQVLREKVLELETQVVALDGMLKVKVSPKAGFIYKNARAHYSQTLAVDGSDTWDEFPESDEDITELSRESDAEAEEEDIFFQEELTRLNLPFKDIEDIPNLLINFGRHRVGAFDF
jgi:hypothetical protein